MPSYILGGGALLSLFTFHCSRTNLEVHVCSAWIYSGSTLHFGRNKGSNKKSQLLVSRIRLEMHLGSTPEIVEILLLK